MSEPSPADTLASLTTSLDALEAALAPLEAQQWSETIGELAPLERAKMDVLAAYTVNDLVWVYLKMKGVDPSTHEVTSELERIKKYYGKVKSIEEPEAPRSTIDAAAAKRFVLNSLPRAQHLAPVSSAELATAQKLRQEAAAEEEAMLRRVGKAGRFRFVDKEGAERVVVGVDGEGVGDVVMEDGEGEGEEDGVDATEGFFAELDREILEGKGKE
ncbi:hypothetical protein IAT38_002730 [Cryptococcus sp. DSM 104549]